MVANASTLKISLSFSQKVTVPRHPLPQNSGIVPPIDRLLSVVLNQPHTINAVKIEPDMLHLNLVYSWSGCNISLCCV